MKSITARGLATAICLTFALSASAANRQARQLLAQSETAHAALLAQFPALGQIDAAIRVDCSAKNEGRLAADAFCGCASAVTMSVWRSGADPQMVPRLKAYLAAPSEADAQAFLKYQGPELYRPLYTEATKP